MGNIKLLTGKWREWLRLQGCWAKSRRQGTTYEPNIFLRLRHSCLQTACSSTSFSDKTDALKNWLCPKTVLNPPDRATKNVSLLSEVKAALVSSSVWKKLWEKESNLVLFLSPDGSSRDTTSRILQSRRKIEQCWCRLQSALLVCLSKSTTDILRTTQIVSLSTHFFDKNWVVGW